MSMTPRGAVPQVVDLYVSTNKFREQLEQYGMRTADYARRGWWILEANYPTVFAVFAAPQLTPPAVVCGVLIDFTNYDLDPPSVTLVNPFTKEPYRKRNLPIVMHRAQSVAMPAPEGAPVGLQLQFMEAVQLMQAHQPDDVPFLCIPGVREYHQHPAHTGDHWLLHRGGGEGTLFHILNTIYTYGVQPLNGYNVAVALKGFSQNEPPE